MLNCCCSCWRPFCKPCCCRLCSPRFASMLVHPTWLDFDLTAGCPCTVSCQAGDVSFTKHSTAIDYASDGSSATTWSTLAKVWPPPLPCQAAEGEHAPHPGCFSGIAGPSQPPGRRLAQTGAKQRLASPFIHCRMTCGCCAPRAAARRWMSSSPATSARRRPMPVSAEVARTLLLLARPASQRCASCSTGEGQIQGAHESRLCEQPKEQPCQPGPSITRAVAATSPALQS